MTGSDGDDSVLLPLLPADVQQHLQDSFRSKLDEVYANEGSPLLFAKSLQEYVSFKYKLPTEDRIKLINIAWGIAQKDSVGMAEQAKVLGVVASVMPKREDLRGKFPEISWTKLRDLLTGTHFVDMEKGMFHLDSSRVRSNHLGALLMFIKRVNWYINPAGDRSVVEEVLKSSAVLLTESSTAKEKMLAQALIEVFVRPYGATQGMHTLLLRSFLSSLWIFGCGYIRLQTENVR